MNPSDDTLSLVTGGTTRLTINNSSSTFAGDVSLPDSKKAYFGTSNDLEIYHDGSNSYIKDAGTGNLEIRSNFLKVKSPTAEDMIWAQENAGVTLFHNNVSKLATTSIGVIVSGSIEAVGGSIFVYDGNEFRAGDAGDLRIGHDATNSYLKNNTGDLYINQAAVTKSIIFKVSNANALDTTAITIDSSGNSTFAGQVNITKSGADPNLVITNNTAGGDFIKCVGETGDTVFTLDSDGTGGEAALRMYKDGVLKNYFAANGNSYFNNVGNVGIGTDSPDAKLEVVGAISTGNGASVRSEISSPVGSGNASLLFASNAGNVNTNIAEFIFTNSLNGSSTRNELMRIDSSGNVDINAGVLNIGASRGTYIDASEDSSSTGHIFVSNDAAGDFGQLAGNLILQARIHPTVYRDIIFAGGLNTAEALMTIQGEGNVGIGTDSPDTKLTINSGTANVAMNVVSTDASASIAFADNTTTAYNYNQIGAIGNDLKFVTSTTERMRITSGGEVLIGTQVNNGYPLEIEANSGGGQIYLKRSASYAEIFMGGSTVADTAFFIRSAGAGGVKLLASATAWASASDESLKENIKPLENALDKIKDYRCIEYTLKESPEDKKIGFIAQDWEEDYPQIVDKDDEGLLRMKYTETIPVLLKAIQELKAEVDKLKQECKCKN